MKTILFISLLITLGLQVTVTDTDKCSVCTEFKSQTDCENNRFGCEWKASACAVKTITTETFLTYCQTIGDPATKCAKTFGCAYVDSKCTHFTGCTAYVKTTLAECQAISGQCITNGVTCDDAKLCKDYTKEVCETNPGLLSPYKCKLDGETCRELKCTEADATNTTDDQCDAWQSGCVTTGQGCIDVLPNCNGLTGTAETCLKMVGSNGKCILDSTSTTGACKLRVCSEAQLTTYDDTTCGDYKTGCKSTGFGCVDTLQGCNSYTGNQTSCLNFIGSDGKCAADAAATQCRARKCEDKVSAVLSDCTTYLDGCKTNGITCVTTLGNCNTYKGTATTCAKIIGFDGNCKGTSTTDPNASCAVKTCADDDTGKETSDSDCQKIQSDCKTTGQGCVKTFTTTCSSYTDDGNCNKYVGSDGKCKAGAGGATPKCAVRACADNTTATTNTECQNYKPGCVTNGAGCVAEATCVLTTLKAACSSPRSSATEICGWTDSCVAKSCTSFGANQSLCENTKISNANPCIWKTNTCQSALCSDYTSTDDAVCNSKKEGCVTNGTKCADPAVCAEFAGTMTTCRSYKAKCTNTNDSVVATTPCIDRTCGDSDITASQDSDCENYLTGCVFAGNNKCISKTSACTAYTGASTGDCENFTGYVSAAADRVKCWWSATSLDATKCVAKTCELATGMTDNTGCGGFLSGCVYDGKDSCVDEDAGCSSLKYKTSADECQSMTGKKGLEKCYNGSLGSCKKRACSDAPITTDYDTDGECGIFLTGCVTKGQGCIDSTSVCSSYSGTSTQCAGFKGNSIPCLRKLACVKPTVSCASKTDATSNKDCQTYLNTCALTFGSTNCQDTQANCTGYVVTGTSDSEKIAYCNTVKTSGGAFCAYDPATTTTCVARTCALWSLSTKVTCTDYAGSGACTIGKNQQCFVIGACNTYTLPASITSAANKKTFCNNQWNTKGGLCSHDGTAATTCKEITTCEEVVSPTTQDDCFDQSKQSNCVLIGTGCVTIKTTCESYDITNIAAGNKTALCASLKSNNSGVIKACKFTSGNACSTHTCEELSPTNASDCNALPNCTYYPSKCYTNLSSCITTDIPNNLTLDSDKLSFCQTMKNLGGTEFCSFTSGTKCDVPKSCADYSGLTAAASATDPANLNMCKTKRDKTGTICTYVDNAAACSSATGAEICTLLATGITTDADCDLKTLPKGCKKDTGASCIAKAACTAMTTSPSLTNCNILTGPDGFYCSFVASAAACSVAADSCSTLNGSDLATCQTFINKYGKTCSWRTGTKCTDPDCVDTVSPKSQADCDLTGSGCTFQNDSCVKLASTCAAITFPASIDTDDEKFIFCNGIVTSSSEVCTFKKSATNCIVAAGCNSYTAEGTDFATKLTYCKKFINTDNYDCTFSTGGNCQEVADLCTSYTVGAAADCTSLKDSFGRSCAVNGSSTTCAYAACSSITSPTKQEDCDLVAAGCTYQNNKCVQLGACSSYSTGGSGALTLCAGLRDTDGNLCKAALDADANCTARACNDAATTYFTSNKECQDYSSKCKFDGVGCVDVSAACNTLYGDATTCPLFLDDSGQGKCGAASPATDSVACDSTTCEMNITALSQSDCDSFITNGGCKWRNPGCYSKTVPCSQYRGTATECQGYVGNSVKCFGDSATRAACRDRSCDDKKTATDDADCAAFMDDCIFNGEGCVHKSAGCSVFKGTNATCKNFKATNKTKWCWSISSTQGFCSERTCANLQGLSDSECKAHYYDDSNCITDGTGCVYGPKTCSQFRGNDDSCSKFTATDGPCKASSFSTSAVSCAPRVCYEAPNTYTTDQQCKDYHPTCKTNGRGCQATVNCTDISNKTSCAANTSCTWTSSCRATSTTCSSLTTSGQSVCVNNPTQKCAWYTGGGNSANAKCRDYTCEDYDATLITHQACQTASNNACTTNGAGCVTFGTCSTYTNKSTCESATTTEKSKKCKWEGTTCRQQKCSDLTGADDTVCDNLLTGCKSNGTNCIGPNYDCSIFNGAEKFCLIDSTGQPCLYKEGTCYSYDNCTDITVTPTQTFCQKISTNCVQGSTSCKALNQCSKYENKDSCLIGINNTKCGWLPTNACAEFKQCGDAAGTTWLDCLAWNISCVSDGTNCVPIGDCGSYLKPLSCEGNYDTANNACFWTGSACRLKQCSDGTGVTDGDCVTNIVKEGVCTTNGTSCVLRAACSSYSTEAACTVGSDGVPCIYSFPLGTTTGNKSCRPKDCTDILGTSNDQCIGQLGTKQCVSNGKTCVSQGTCASYKNKISCAAGGSDNSRCVFTAAPTTADPLAGTCQAFTSCASASADSATCLTNRSCKYTDATKKCETTDCKTFTPSGQCQPIPSFDGKTFTLCTTSANGCTAGDPTTLVQTECYSLVSRYTYTWNASTSKCQSCKGSTTTPNNSTNGNTTTNTTTDSGYVLGVSMALAILGFLA